MLSTSWALDQQSSDFFTFVSDKDGIVVHVPASQLTHLLPLEPGAVVRVMDAGGSRPYWNTAALIEGEANRRRQAASARYKHMTQSDPGGDLEL